MKKITLLIILVLATTFGYAQNVFTNGTFDDPSAWTIIQQNANNNATATIADGIATFDDVTQGSWGSEGHVAIYKAFTVASSGYYQFDADVTTNGVDEHWFELWVGTATPAGGAEYNSDSGATNLLALNAWDCGDYKTYSGSWLTTGCKGLDGKIQLETGTTYYALIRTGGITWGTGVLLDNITLVSADPPPAPISELTVDFETATEFGSADGGTYTDLTTNTVTDGVNSSALAGQVSDCNASWWSHVFINTTGFDLSSGDRGISLMVKGERATPIMLKLQVGDDYDTNHELVGESYTTPGVWQKITWDLSQYTTNDRSRLVFFFDVQSDTNSGGSTDTFQFDNLVFGAFASLSTKNFKIEGLRTYPNPATSSWAISTKNQVIKSVEVFNLLGSKVVSLKPNALKVNIDASSLAPGMYITNITTDLGTASRKLIKQ
tara:strand:+ start:15856 stop:17163 length:1308 start_codon:yes stop_codon:yes gene_type:complete